MLGSEVLYVAQIDPARREELLRTFSGDPPYDIAATDLDRHTVFIARGTSPSCSRGTTPSRPFAAWRRSTTCSSR
jgi:hypothetical protein